MSKLQCLLNDESRMTQGLSGRNFVIESFGNSFVIRFWKLVIIRGARHNTRRSAHVRCESGYSEGA